MPQFLKENPNVKIQLFENFPRENEKKLLNGELDCYIGQTPEAIDSSLEVVTSGEEKYYVVIPQTSSYYQADQFILEPNALDLKKSIARTAYFKFTGFSN